MDFRFNPLFLI